MNKKLKPVTIDGIKYKSLTEALIAHGIPKSLYYRRRGKGWEIEEAITTPKGKRRK